MAFCMRIRLLENRSNGQNELRWLGIENFKAWCMQYLFVVSHMIALTQDTHTHAHTHAYTTCKFQSVHISKPIPTSISTPTPTLTLKSPVRNNTISFCKRTLPAGRRYLALVYRKSRPLWLLHSYQGIPRNNHRRHAPNVINKENIAQKSEGT